MNPNNEGTVGALVEDVRENGPVYIRLSGMTYRVEYAFDFTLDPDEENNR